MIGFALGILAGLVSSWVIWLYLNHMMTPEIMFGSNIARVTDENGVRYLFAYRNSGKRRVIDLQIRAAIRIKGIVSWDPELSQTYYLKTSSSHRPSLNPQKTITSRICLSDSIELQHGFIPENIRHKLLKDETVFEDLLAVGQEACLCIFVYGYDEYSGARKLFESPPYKLSSIRDGLFNRRSLVIESNKERNPSQPGTAGDGF